MHACWQLEGVNAQWEQRQRQGLVKRVGNSYDAESKAMLLNVRRLQKPVEADKEAVKTFQESHQRFLRLAITNYCG